MDAGPTTAEYLFFQQKEWKNLKIPIVGLISASVMREQLKKMKMKPA